MKDFVPHKESLQLEGLGFDEKCDYYFTPKGEVRQAWGLFNYPKKMYPDYIKRATFSQAFRFFREKYGYWSYIKEAKKGTAMFYIEKFDEKFYNSEIYNYYEEAELECLRKLIEYAKKD